MKPSKYKKRPAKRYTAKRRDGGNPIIDKLLQLKYRMNDAYRNGGSSYENLGDKLWVMDKIEYLRYSNENKLTKGEMVKCNEMWRHYEG